MYDRPMALSPMSLQDLVRPSLLFYHVQATKLSADVHVFLPASKNLLLPIDRGVYEVRPTSGLSSGDVLAIVEKLEAAAPAINAKAGVGVGGEKFKLADIV